MCKTSNQLSFIASAIVLLGLSLPVVQVSANPAPNSNRPLVISQSFKPPSRGTAPPSAGGATRGKSCLKGSAKPLTALMPQNLAGLTYSGNPTFYWYVPKSTAKTAKFLLLNNDDSDVIYETTLTLPNKSGIVGFSLPPTASVLEVGKQYHWYLVVGCNQLDQGANPAVEGWVERIAPEASISSQLQKVDTQGQAQIYADNGIWHEAVTTLANLRRTNPTDANAIAGWNELLKSVNLAAIAAEPLFEVTTGQN